MVHLQVKEKSAKLFYNRNNQSVRFPKGFELDAEEVIISKDGDNLIIKPKPKNWNSYFLNSQKLSNDYPDVIDDLPLQTRDEF